MSDETRKKGDSFEVFAVRDEGKDYVLGLRDIVNKSSETCLDTFKTMLSDIEQSSSTDAGNVILANIKNTMSDRAATEKKFHSLLEDYRQEVLPQVTQNWDQLSEPEQDAHAHMNNFYCGLHLLVNFAEVSGKVLKLYEETQQDVEEEQEGSSRKKEECKTVRFVRQASKCLARGADEKNGCFQEFRTFLLAGADDEEERKGKLKLSKLLVPFRGNRFNILFLNAESIFFLHNDIQEFVQHVHTPSNALHKDVADNITSKLLLSTLKALGICAKIVTGPFWRALESKGTTLQDANALYLNLYSFLCEAKTDATDVMNGELAPFPDLLEKDDVFNRLTAADPQDAATCTVLQLIFSAWLSLLEKSAADHLPGGRYWDVGDTLAAETASVPRHNKLPERIFGLLDDLTKFRPVASTLCNESYIMFSLNKTSEWMQSLPPEKLEYMDASRKEGRELRKQYQKRIRGIAIEEARRASLLQKREKEERERKKTGEKLSITNDMLYYGLWQDPKAVDNLLSTMPTVAEKKKALKTQLSFRKVILGQVAEKTLFQYSEKGKEYTIAQLTKNVKTLIMMSLSEHQLPAPFVGRKFTHFQISDGKRTPYKGTVISSVPGYPAWYNVVYTTDPSDVYVYKLQEDRVRRPDLRQE